MRITEQTKKIFAIVCAAVIIAVPLFQTLQPKPARAILGAADTVIIIANPYQTILDSIEAGLKAGAATLFLQLVNTVLTKVESNFKISNFLYYSDALVNGQYLQDYLNKYVINPSDQRMILTFLPQFNCGQTINNSTVLQQKAQQYLGFDPKTLTPSDPQFYQKLSRMGDFLSSPNGWQSYYQNLAQQALAQANQAAQNEINSPGLKTARGSSGTIASSINHLVQTEAGGLIAQFGLGPASISSNNFISSLISTSMVSLFNSYVIPTGTVFKESATCMNPLQNSPVTVGTISAQPQTSAASSCPANAITSDQNNVDPGTDVNLSWDVSYLKPKGATKAILAPVGDQVNLTGSTTVNIMSTSDYAIAAFDTNNNVVGECHLLINVNQPNSGGPRGPGL